MKTCLACQLLGFLAAADVRSENIVQIDTAARGAPAGILVGGVLETVNHELWGLSSQMVFGESFEEPAVDGISGNKYNRTTSRSGLVEEPIWMPWASGAGVFNVATDAFNGNQSQSITNGSIANFGLGQQGMHIVGDQPYDGYLYVKARGSATVTVRLISDGATSSVDLASQTFIVEASSEWKRLDLAFVPQASTYCERTLLARTKCIPTPEFGLACYECSGALVIDVVGAAVLVDMVFLQPGDWDRFRGLPVRKDVAEAMFKTAGWQVVRFGGGMSSADGFRWKHFRGPPELRPPYRDCWYHYQSPNFRVFEVLELCEAADAVCAVTISCRETPSDMADFVEYVYGNSSTTWGMRRVADGRVDPYKPFTIEVGNEQALTDDFVGRVVNITTAMVGRAKEIAVPVPLKFSFGGLYGPHLSGEGLNITLSLLKRLRFLGAHVAWDAHIGGDSNQNADDFAAMMLATQSFFKQHKSKMKLAVFEENGQTHNLQRALVHARNNIVSSQYGSFLPLTTAANGVQVFGWNDNSWDQGQIFMTPDSAWLQPFGWAQHMLSSHSNFNIPLKVGNTSEGLEVGAYVDASGAVGIRAVNWSPDAIHGKFLLMWPECTTVPSLEVYELTSQSLTDVNTPLDPQHVSPQTVSNGTVSLTKHGPLLDFMFKPSSFVTMALRVNELVFV